MNSTFMIASAVAVSLLGTGCATKKYVAQTVAPVESRVTGTESKNVDQDKQIAGQGQQIGEIDRDLSRTKERLTDADAKAAAAGQAAQQANQKAEGAQKSADDSKTFAQQGLQHADQRSDQIEKTMEGMNKFKMSNSATVLFDLGQSKLTKEGKEQLDEFAKQVSGLDRFVIEVQGFTDKTGSADTNERLSQARAQEVARYLANQHKIPVRSITMLGSGYALPVADDSTRDGRKQNRRVEIRLFIPEAAVGTQSVASLSNKAD